MSLFLELLAMYCRYIEDAREKERQLVDAMRCD